MIYDERLSHIANEYAHRVKLNDDDREIDEIHIDGRPYYIRTMECTGKVNGTPCVVRYDVEVTPITDIILQYSYRVFVIQ